MLAAFVSQGNSGRATAADAFWTAAQVTLLLTWVRATHRVLGTTPRPPIPRAEAIALVTSQHHTPTQPTFGGTSGTDPPPSERRLWVLALLYANPETPCTAPQVAHAFGLRESSVRAARPTTAHKVGRAIMAPFGHWLAELRHAGLVPSWRPEYDPPAPSPRSSPRTRPETGHLRPLGGPGGS